MLRAKSGETPALVHAHPNETVREAIDILREYGVSQMPVVRAEPPVTAGEVVGSVGEKQLLDALFTGTAALADALERHMSPPLPIIGSGESVTEAVAALSTADALLVHVDGKPAGVITRQDLLGHLGRIRRLTFVLLGTGPTCIADARRGYGERMTGFNTRAIHAGQEPDPLTGAVTVPIYATSTFKQDGVGGLRGGYEYSRSANPTRTALEVALAALEADSARGLAFASRARRRRHLATHGVPSRRPRRAAGRRVRRDVPAGRASAGPLGTGVHGRAARRSGCGARCGPAAHPGHLV